MIKINKKNQKIKDSIVKKIESDGFKEDQYGNYRNKDIRYKFQNRSYRIEKLVGNTLKRWHKVSGEYYSNYTF